MSPSPFHLNDSLQLLDVFRSCFAGFNITIPYKEKIIPYLDEVDGAVSACGAVNTVEIRDGRMIGHITDGLGMLRAIEEQRDYHQTGAMFSSSAAVAQPALRDMNFLQKAGRVTFAVRNKQKGEELVRNELADTQKDGHHAILSCLFDSTIVQVRMIF